MAKDKPFVLLVRARLENRRWRTYRQEISAINSFYARRKALDLFLCNGFQVLKIRLKQEANQ